MIFLMLLLLSLVFPVTSNSRPAEQKSTNEVVFKALWDTFDRKYGLFAVKSVDWDALYSEYLPLANRAQDEDQLFHVCADLLSHLQDKHVWLISNRLGWNCRLKVPCALENLDLAKKAWKSPFSESLIDRKYLRGERSLYSGEISGGSLPFEIAYLRISAFPDDVNQVGLAIDKAFKSKSGAKAMVVDIRDNRGGSDQGVVAISNRFADQRRLFMMSAIRSGQNRNDLASQKEWFLEPTAATNFHCPVALLINQDTFSAGETFTLAMRVLPQVKIVGEPTAGAFSDAEDGVLPNGWQFTYSIGVWRDAKRQLWEGKGVPPDVAIKTSPADLARDIDPVLEWAIDYLKVHPCNR